MDEKVLVRFIKYMAIATFAMFTLWIGYSYLAPDQSGDYYVRQGDIHLDDHDWDEALASFDKALEETPEHRGALMGKAIAFLQSGRYGQAEAALDHLIDHLQKTLESDDATGWGTLAAAYANRGILHDRTGRYQKALTDYTEALRLDAEVVSGPGLIDRVLYGMPNPATVRDRAAYLKKQLALPEEERLLHVPELDAEQRMHKP
jgi:tetratricopeptide (TPR) repeat protein